MRSPFPFDLSALLEGPGTKEQLACEHLLASQMPDGKFFCPSCRLVRSIKFGGYKPTP